MQIKRGERVLMFGFYEKSTILPGKYLKIIKSWVPTDIMTHFCHNVLAWWSQWNLHKSFAYNIVAIKMPITGLGYKDDIIFNWTCSFKDGFAIPAGVARPYLVSEVVTKLNNYPHFTDTYLVHGYSQVLVKSKTTQESGIPHIFHLIPLGRSKVSNLAIFEMRDVRRRRNMGGISDFYAFWDTLIIWLYIYTR